MPMFHDPGPPPEKDHTLSAPAPRPLLARYGSEESIRTEFCEGPLLEEPIDRSPRSDALEPHHSTESNSGPEISDRGELIQRIKNGENPTWAPNRKFKDLFAEDLKAQQWSSAELTGSPLLPAIEFPANPSAERKPAQQAQRSSPALAAPRPGSALHSGVFTSPHNAQARPGLAAASSNLDPFFHHAHQKAGAAAPASPWTGAGLDEASPIRISPRPILATVSQLESHQSPRSRAPSLHSFSSSFVLKPPTSPLVQQSNNDDPDLSPIHLSSSPSKSTRRHTLPPHSLQALKSLPTAAFPTLAQTARQPASVKREGAFPWQSHQHRRSMTSVWSQQASSPQTPPYLRSRRPSLSAESPLQHASMVGSYEESILRGRMSTGPSKPLDFTAEIGALGRGNCKPKFPEHVMLDFPAVYYSWTAGNGRSVSSIDDEPSPYVGSIDLEHSLPPPEAKEKRRKRKLPLDTDSQDKDVSGVELQNDLRKREKRKRRSPSPTLRAPPGGSYRIPQQGHLQILIKNPNKTAVKLFFIPYDLSDMQAGTKTFIRQRSYSLGPIIPNPITSRSVSEPGQSSISRSPASLASKDKRILRYLIHLNICCPSKGRFYLYQTIRVVFANRVPDNKESLHTEVQIPEPRFSVYKPYRESASLASSAGARLVADKAQRRSYGLGGNAGLSQASFDIMDGIQYGTGAAFSLDPLDNQSSVPPPPLPPMPTGLVRSKKAPQGNVESTTLSAEQPVEAEIQAPPSPLLRFPIRITTGSRPTSPTSEPQSPLVEKVARIASIASNLSSSYRSNSSNSSEGYGKLSKGEAGYGGLFGRPGTPEAGEGLLARKLRGLGAEKDSLSREKQ